MLPTVAKNPLSLEFIGQYGGGMLGGVTDGDQELYPPTIGDMQGVAGLFFVQGPIIMTLFAYLHLGAGLAQRLCGHLKKNRGDRKILAPDVADGIIGAGSHVKGTLSTILLRGPTMNQASPSLTSDMPGTAQSPPTGLVSCDAVTGLAAVGLGRREPMMSGDGRWLGMDRAGGRGWSRGWRSWRRSGPGLRWSRRVVPFSRTANPSL